MRPRLRWKRWSSSIVQRSKSSWDIPTCAIPTCSRLSCFWFAWDTGARQAAQSRVASSISSSPSFPSRNRLWLRRRKPAAESLCRRTVVSRRSLVVGSLGSWYPSYRLSSRQRIAQFANRLIQRGVAKVRRKLRQGFQDEAALVHCGMRDGEPLGIDDGVTEEQNVDVNGARAFLLYALPAHLLFNAKNCIHQLRRGLAGFEGNHTIQEPRLLNEVHGFGFIV